MVDFFAAVIERSRSLPVVVDFWAAWCAPCRLLGPVLESLAAEAAGRWELVQLDVDAQPALAEEYGVRGIPAVKMFHEGRVVAEFVGALPEGEVRRWLEASLPDPRAARLAAIAGDVGALETFVAEQPDYLPARVALADALVTEDPGRARELVAPALGDANLAAAAEDLASLADLMEPPAAPPKLGTHLEAAREALRAGDVPRTLEELLEAVAIDRAFGEELGRRAAVALFRRLGQDHELTRGYQRRLGMILHP